MTRLRYGGWRGFEGYFGFGGVPSAHGSGDRAGVVFGLLGGCSGWTKSICQVLSVVNLGGVLVGGRCRSWWLPSFSCRLVGSLFWASDEVTEKPGLSACWPEMVSKSP